MRQTTLLNFEAEGAVLPTLPTILITESIRNGRAEGHPEPRVIPSDHSHAFQRLNPAHRHPVTPILPRQLAQGIKDDVQFQRGALGIWLHAFVHIDGGGEQLAFRGHLLGPIGHGTSLNSHQDQLQQPPPPSGPPSNRSNFRMRGPRSVLAHLLHGFWHVSISPSLRHVSAGDDGSTTGCSSACTPFHPSSCSARRSASPPPSVPEISSRGRRKRHILDDRMCCISVGSDP